MLPGCESPHHPLLFRLRKKTVEQKRARKLAESAAKEGIGAPIPGAAGPPPGKHLSRSWHG